MKKAATVQFINSLAQKHGITYDQAVDIVRSEFGFTVNIMRSGSKALLDFKNVMLPYLGKFTFTKSRRKQLVYKNEHCGTTDNRGQSTDNQPSDAINQGV